MNNHYVKLFSFFLSIVITVGLVPQVSGEEIFANTTSGSEQSVTVVCGKSQTLSSDSSGVTWSSSNPKIASVDANGKLTANKAGKTTVTARSSDKTDTYKIQVLYKDVTSTDDFWYEPVNWLTVRGVVKGYSDQTEFRPANECTRSQMLTFLWRLQGQPEPKSKTCRFPDVKETSYYFKPVIWAEEQGITTGYKDGTFKPKNNCTRAQAVTFMWRMAGKPAPKTTESKFPDVKDTDYFYRASLWASENKILEGMPDGTFDPQGKLLRRQMVTFLYRFDMYINHNLPTPTAKPTSKPTATPTAKPTATPTATATPTSTATPTATPTVIPDPMDKLTVSFENGFGMPANATHIRVSLFDKEGNTTADVQTVNIGTKAIPEIKFKEVDLNTVKAFVEILDAAGGVISTYDFDGELFPEMVSNGEDVIVIHAPGQDVTLSIANAYAIDSDKTEVSVSYNDGTEKRAYFKDIDYDKTGGTCTVTVKADDLNGSVSNVRLLVDGVPFEWLDYSSPQSLSGGSLDLDVDANEFANGDYSAGTVMQVANPRHLDNVRKHLDGSFIQISDIDFDGSCGITNVITTEITATGTRITIVTENNFDYDSGEAVTPRFYGGFIDKYKALGWNPIGGIKKERFDVDAMRRLYFKGTYDGNGHSISNLVCSIDVEKYPGTTLGGLFGVAGSTDPNNPAVLKNIVIDDSCSVASTVSTGPVLGCAMDYVEISGCKTSAEVYAYYYAGGILGQAGIDMSNYKCDVTISNCESNSRCFSDDAGGILGWFSYGNLTVSDCVFGENGLLVAGDGLGGITYNMGINSNDTAKVSNCRILGTLVIPADPGEAKANSSGGLFGAVEANMIMSGTTTVAATFDYSVEGAKYYRIGGVYGYSQYISADSMKAILKGHVTVADGCIHGSDASKNIGRIGGLTWIDSFD